MTAASPRSASPQPNTHSGETGLRSHTCANRLVNTGSVARISAACIAEVLCCPKVNIRGKTTNPVRPDTASRMRACLSRGSPVRMIRTIGKAIAPAMMVLRRPTWRAGISATASLENSGVPPQTTMTSRATPSGSSEDSIEAAVDFWVGAGTGLRGGGDEDR